MARREKNRNAQRRNRRSGSRKDFLKKTRTTKGRVNVLVDYNGGGIRGERCRKGGRLKCSGAFVGLARLNIEEEGKR